MNHISIQTLTDICITFIELLQLLQIHSTVTINKEWQVFISKHSVTIESCYHSYNRLSKKSIIKSNNVLLCELKMCIILSESVVYSLLL